MAASIRCHCQGNPECKLCFGKKFYPYQPGPRGWMPFRCPTCQGARNLPGSPNIETPCFTCAGTGGIDPANPPFAKGWWGALRVGWKAFFGGG
ncbi:unnamed protein product [Gemmata massiliana]|uniref:Uncharacterized protein n=1 Tax=Gemmata massiliana TaxID=1210884 RepID=A0A6P2D672_9BACT|nr:unnamed protein product [Gemmata massiliana]